VFKNRGIAFRLVFSILLSGPILALIFGYSYRVSRQLIEKEIEGSARNLVRATVNRMDAALLPVEKAVHDLAVLMGNVTPATQQQLKDLLRAVVENDPDIYGSAIAFGPHPVHPEGCLAPYYFKGGDDVKYACLDTPSYRYDEKDWYQMPRELGRAVWSEPYYDRGGGDTLMATYSVPFFQTVSKERQFRGVVTADISLSWLTQVVSSIRTGESGYAFLLSKKGRYLTHPIANLILKRTVSDEATERGDGGLHAVGKAMTEGKSGFSPLTSMVTGKPCWIAYAPLAFSNWSLGILFPQDELTADITRLNHVAWVLGLLGVALLAAVIIMIARSLTRPLTDLAKATEGIVSGNLNVPLPAVPSRRDEVAVLTEAFGRMVVSLRRYIRDLTDATAQKERIESELRVARDIQLGMLPKALPPASSLNDVEIYARLEPARQVGGDFYDFFLLDDDHLCFTIGDVAGKGVPASLFMTVTQTLNKTEATSGRGPGDILARVNNDLCWENPSFMFVTLFMGVLNVRTGDLAFSNGGHNPPYLILREGRIEPLELTDGLALGIERDVRYRAKHVSLLPGDTVFLYTDGVTEAMNQKQELFTQNRLAEALFLSRRRSPDHMAAEIMGRLQVFCEGAPQADDITLLIVRFHGQGDRRDINKESGRLSRPKPEEVTGHGGL